MRPVLHVSDDSRHANKTLWLRIYMDSSEAEEEEEEEEEEAPTGAEPCSDALGADLAGPAAVAAVDLPSGTAVAPGKKRRAASKTASNLFGSLTKAYGTYAVKHPADDTLLFRLNGVSRAVTTFRSVFPFPRPAARVADSYCAGGPELQPRDPAARARAVFTERVLEYCVNELQTGEGLTLQRLLDQWGQLVPADERTPAVERFLRYVGIDVPSQLAVPAAFAPQPSAPAPSAPPLPAPLPAPQSLPPASVPAPAPPPAHVHPSLPRVYISGERVSRSRDRCHA